MFDRLLRMRSAKLERDSTGSLLDAMPLPDRHAYDGHEHPRAFSRPMGTLEQDNRPDSLLNQLDNVAYAHDRQKSSFENERRREHLASSLDKRFAGHNSPSEFQFRQEQDRQFTGSQRPHNNVEQQANALAQELEKIRLANEHFGDEPVRMQAGQMQANQMPAGQFPMLDIDQLFLTILAGWRTIIVCGFLGAVVVYGYAKTKPNEYEAVAQLLVDPRGAKILDDDVIAGNLNNAATISYLESQMRIIGSASVLSRVVGAEKLRSDAEFIEDSSGGLFSMILGGAKSTDTTQNSVLEKLQEKLTISRSARTYVISIGATTRDAEKSARIANTVANEYIANEIGAQSSVATSASKNLTERLESLRENVRVADQKIQDYKAEKQIIGVSGSLPEEVQLSKLNEQLAFAKVQTGEAKTKAALAQKTKLADVVSGAISSGLRSSELSQLRISYAKLKSQSDRVGSKLGPRHPDRIAADVELKSTRAQITGEIQRIIAEAGKDHERALARQQELAQQVNVLKTMTVQTNSSLIKLRELQRDADASRQVYEQVLLRSRETRARSDSSFTNARLIQAATPPLEKTGPIRKYYAAGGLILGGALGGLLVLLKSYSSRSPNPSAPKTNRQRSLFRRGKRVGQSVQPAVGNSNEVPITHHWSNPQSFPVSHQTENTPAAAMPTMQAPINPQPIDVTSAFQPSPTLHGQPNDAQTAKIPEPVPTEPTPVMQAPVMQAPVMQVPTMQPPMMPSMGMPAMAMPTMGMPGASYYYPQMMPQMMPQPVQQAAPPMMPMMYPMHVATNPVGPLQTSSDQTPPVPKQKNQS